MLADIISILAGGIVTLIFCELLTRHTRIVRFKVLYSAFFFFCVTFMPSILRVIAFPYNGALAGMTFIVTLLGTLAGILAYAGMLSICVLADIEIKRRSILSIAAFFIANVIVMYNIHAR